MWPAETTLASLGLLLLLDSFWTTRGDAHADRSNSHFTTCVQKPSLSFLAVGDTGEPAEPQRRVAAQMALSAVRNPIDFLLLLGDCFYPTGVKSMDDPQWNSTYEVVYAQQQSLKVPHYAVNGNHDYYNKAPLAGVERSHYSMSSTWRMPSLWYTREFLFDGNLGCEGYGSVSALFVFLDTMVLTEGDGHQRAKSTCSPEKAHEHWMWLKKVLSEATAEWIIVVGHHPVYSAGEHADQTQLVKELDPLLVEHGVDLYISGHDHDMEMLSNGKGLTYAIAGSGSKLDNIQVSHKKLVFQKLEYGFTSLQVNRSHLEIKWMSQTGGVLHKHVQTPRKLPKTTVNDEIREEETKQLHTDPTDLGNVQAGVKQGQQNDGQVKTYMVGPVVLFGLIAVFGLMAVTVGRKFRSERSVDPENTAFRSMEDVSPGRPVHELQDLT